MNITQILFWFLSVVALFSALMLITSKNPVYSVLWLIVTFFAISGHYILLNAQFLAVVHLIVYTGAIMVLFLFVIMLAQQSGIDNADLRSREPLLGVISAITPFNHPLNQVVHKVAPAVATNNRMVLKPSEKAPRCGKRPPGTNSLAVSSAKQVQSTGLRCP